MVPTGTSASRSLDAAALSAFLGRDVGGYRAEVRSSSGTDGLRDYAVQVCWNEGCVEGSVRGPAPIAGVAGTPPATVAVGRGTLEVLVEGEAEGVAPDVSVTNGDTLRRVQTWGLSRLEGLPGGSYSVTALGIRNDRYTYEAPAVAGAQLGSGEGARVRVRYQPTSGAISVSVSAPAEATVSAVLSGPSGNHTVRESALIPYLAPGAYSLAAPDIRCGDYVCEPRVEGSPVTLAAGETRAITLAYGYASGNLRIISDGVVQVRGPAGYERSVTGSATLRDLTPGTYTLSPLELRRDGYTLRAEGGTVEIVAGETAEARIEYRPVTGRLRVEVEAPQDGVLGRVTKDSEALHSFGQAGGEWELAPGRYGVQPIAFVREDIRYEAAAVGVDVQAGQTSRVTLEFIPVTAVLDYAVSGLPTGALAAAELAGPNGYKQGLPTARRLTGLAVGSYRFEADGVESNGYTYLPDPNTQNLSLAGGQRYSLNLRYVRQEAALSLSVVGAPAGTSPNIWLRREGATYPLQAGANTPLPTGSFVLEAAPITSGGFTYLPEVSPASLTLRHGETTPAEVRYVRQSGTLRLVLEGLERASMRLTGPSGGSLEVGGDYVLLPGSYTLQADPVEQQGFRYTPSVEGGSFSLAVGETRTVTVRYEAATARLRVQVSGVEGSTPMTLSGPSARTLEGPGTLEFLTPGSYTLTPSAVTRNETIPYGTGTYTYRASPLSLSLPAGQTGEATVSYVRQQGTLVVTVGGLPTGAAAALRLEGQGLSYAFAGGYLNNLPTGSYTLQAEPVRANGYTYRASSQSFVLRHNETQAVTVGYAPASGALRVNLNGPSGMPAPSARVWQGETVVATVQNGSLLEDLLPGSYRIEPLPVRDEQGFDYTATEQTVAVSAGQTASASLSYVKQSAFVDLSVTGAPAPYTLLLSGPRSYSLSAPGRYEIATGSYNASAANLNHAGFLYRATVSPTSLSLAPGQTATLSLTYAKVAGAFRFSVSGLPSSSARTTVSLSGPSSYSTLLGNGTTTTPDLFPGAYTLSTPDVPLNGYTYRASGNAGNYTLNEGDTLPVSLSYAPITGRVQVNLSGVPNGATPTLRIVNGAGTLATFNNTASYELAPGSYTLQADAFQSGGYTYSPSGQGGFTVTAGQTTTLNVSYNATTGRLRVITSGLPFAPNYGISGPRGLSVSQADQTFDDLPPGVYTAAPNTRDQDVGSGVIYRYRAGYNLVGQGEIWGAEQLALDAYRSSQRDAMPGGWVSAGANQLIGVYGCIENRAGYPAQLGFMETLSDGGSPIWTASGWQRGLWVQPGQQGCIETTLQVSNRSGVRVRPFINIEGPWSGVGGHVVVTGMRVTLIGGGPNVAVQPGQTATLYVHYTPTGSVVLQINRTSNNAPVSVVFNGQTFTAPGRYVLNYLNPEYYPLQKNTTYYQGLAYYPSGPDPVLLPGGGRTVEAVVTYTPENRAVLNLAVERQYQDSRYANLLPPALPILQNGSSYYQAGVGNHSISLYPYNTYSSQWSVGYEVFAAQFGCGLFCHDDLIYYIKEISSLPLVPWAGEVYSARVVWGTKICWRRWVSYTCQSY